ncbi:MULTISPECIES: metallophosphoesterase family protein [Deinococcus]|uniref:metallophosphoesterase family protein n=1 Tax=Deinococcus TaxID=1298 RepID=UPI0004861607|nr:MULTISPECIES: metallophosphoesterase family protein [Deinococcus]KEF34763.1 metallophosphoesterase [Deinococcus sp. RL]
MRLAVISDVHGNAPALEAVLRDLRAETPDLVVNLGDQVEGAANPARAAALQHELAQAGALEVRGNNEEKFWPGGRRSALAREYGAWLETQLDARARARLAALPLTVRSLDGRVFACHGTPASAWESLLWAWQPEGTGGFYRARDPRALADLVGPLGAEVVLCGHTHRPGATRVGDTLVVNAGAVSEQVDGDPRARWTLLECRRGRWTADFRAVPYDLEAAVRWAQRHSPFGEDVAALLRSGTFEVRGG